MPDTERQTGQRVTIVAQRPGFDELAWVRFLLGDWAGDVIDDPDRTLILPYSLVVSDRPDSLKGKVLAGVRRLGSVGLLHISDQRYRSRLDAYSSFGWVWRTYYHSGLADLDLRQIPLGPATSSPISVEPTAAAVRRPDERLYTWTASLPDVESRAEVAEALRQVDGGYEQQLARGDPAAVDSLYDSVFAPCPAHEGNLESSRVYEALEAGAIPIVERRRRLDYFHELLGDHPLPTVRLWSEAPRLMAGLLADQTRLTSLHRAILGWWTATKHTLAGSTQADVQRCFATILNGVERDGIPLERPAPRWRGRVEMMRHRPPGSLLAPARRRGKRRS
ncbi:MAG TPA: hypothetical protein VGJ86_23815 [Acidimicrobiales bacterium]